MPTLEAQGHTVGRIARDGERLDLSGLTEADAVVHLAGAGIGDSKWTPERKKLVDQGYTIIVNIGDQMSDLDGGFAERTFKLPNPFYFIP